MTSLRVLHFTLGGIDGERQLFQSLGTLLAALVGENSSLLLILLDRSFLVVPLLCQVRKVCFPSPLGCERFGGGLKRLLLAAPRAASACRADVEKLSK